MGVLASLMPTKAQASLAHSEGRPCGTGSSSPLAREVAAGDFVGSI